MKLLKVGDTITCTLFNGDICTGVVKDIEIRDNNPFHFENFVMECDLDKHKNGVVTMENHWCYFAQINKISSSS